MALTANPRRTRAARLAPEARRAALLEVAVRLLVEQGESFTTTELAHAAGVAEGTIFRYFPDKATLLDACRREVLGVDELLPRFAAAAALDRLDDRLAAAGDAVRDHLARAAGVLGSAPVPRPGAEPPAALVNELLDVVAALFEPDAAHLALPPRALATRFAAVFLGDDLFHRVAGTPLTPTAEVVRTFLDGVRR